MWEAGSLTWCLLHGASTRVSNDLGYTTRSGGKRSTVTFWHLPSWVTVATEAQGLYTKRAALQLATFILDTQHFDQIRQLPGVKVKSVQYLRLVQSSRFCCNRRPEPTPSGHIIVFAFSNTGYRVLPATPDQSKSISLSCLIFPGFHQDQDVIRSGVPMRSWRARHMYRVSFV